MRIIEHWRTFVSVFGSFSFSSGYGFVVTSFWNQMACAHAVLFCVFVLYLSQISASILVWFYVVLVLDLLAVVLSSQCPVHIYSMLCQLPHSTSCCLKRVVVIDNLGEYVD